MARLGHLAIARPGPTLADLERDHSRVAEVRPEDAPRLLAVLAALTLGVAARLGASAPELQGTSSSARWLTPDEAAARANVDRRVVYAWSRRIDWRPFAHRLSRKVLRIEEQGFLRWLGRQTAK